ncbi:hypothetical protein NKH18_21590 [Streptomyces sp. M10(2022)]
MQVQRIELQARGDTDAQGHGGGQIDEPGVGRRQHAFGRTERAEFPQHRHPARQRIANSHVGSHDAECRRVIG